MLLQEQLENGKIFQKNFFSRIVFEAPRFLVFAPTRRLKIEETLKVEIVAWYMEIPNKFCVTKQFYCFFKTYKKSGLGNLKGSA